MLSVLAVAPFLVWPRLRGRLLATDFLPHLYCYMRNPALVWTHVVADTLIGIAYLAISVTLGYLVHKARRGIPFPWMLLAFGLFIVACGGTHFMEVVIRPLGDGEDFYRSRLSHHSSCASLHGASRSDADPAGEDLGTSDR